MYNERLRAHLVYLFLERASRCHHGGQADTRQQSPEAKLAPTVKEFEKKYTGLGEPPKWKGPLLFWKKIRGPTQIISLAYRFISAGFLPTYFFSKDQSCCHDRGAAQWLDLRVEFFHQIQRNAEGIKNSHMLRHKAI